MQQGGHQPRARVTAVEQQHVVAVNPVQALEQHLPLTNQGLCRISESNNSMPGRNKPNSVASRTHRLPSALSKVKRTLEASAARTRNPCQSG